MSKGAVAEPEKNSQNESNTRNKPKREKSAPPTKIVIRGLPPTMTQDTFIEQISPLPDHDYLYFVRADLSLGQFAFSRAYINFLNSEDIFIFTEKFDGYVFVDQKGNEYSAMVEFAPFPKIPKRVSRKKDAKRGTIETDPDYLRFLELREKAAETDSGPPSTQEVLEEIEAKEREMRAHHGVMKVSTPLLDYIRQRKEEKIRIREEKKEERRRREADRRKIREEERRRPQKEAYSRDGGKDKGKVDKIPKQLLTHKDKDSHGTDTDLVTKKLKEVLKINTPKEKFDKQKRESSGKDGTDKEKSREKEKVFREKEHYREQSDKFGDREHHVTGRERDLQRQEREKERAKRREEERTRKNASRRVASSEKKEEHEQKLQSTTQSEVKGQSISGEEKSKQQTVHESKEKQAEASKSSSLGEADKTAPNKDTTNLETASSEETPSKKEERRKEDKEADVKKEDDQKSEISAKPKPERIRNKVGMELTEKGKIIKNKDRPSMQLYRPGMLKKRSTTSASDDSSSVGAQSKEGGKSSAGPDSASTSSSSSPTPPSNKEKPSDSKRRSSAPPIKSKSSSAEQGDTERAKSDDDKVKEDIPVKSRTFKRSFS